MIIDTPTVALAEAATLLRLKLGAKKNWTNFLTDNIRDRQDIAGYTLLPCARQHDERNFRPVYHVQEIYEFIARVLAVMPSYGKEPIKQTILPIDTSKSWRLNRFDKNGSSVSL